MTTIRLTGDLGPLEALELRDRLEGEIAVRRPRIFLDLSAVESVHPAVLAAIVRAAKIARTRSGFLQLAPPTAARACRVIDQVCLNRILP